MASLSERLARLYTGIVYDTLAEIGLAGQALPPAICPLVAGHRLAGPVWTVSGVRTPSIGRDESLLRWTELLSAAPAGHVVVCQPNDSGLAHMGELSAQALKRRGVLGYVVDGGCRDADAIVALGFPVFCRYRTPADITGRWRVDEMGTGVRIGGLDIRTGDYVIGDADGVVIIPGGRAEEVVAKAEAAVGAENEMRAAILAGTDPKEAYLKHGKF